MGLKLVIQDDNGKVLGMVDASSRGKDKPFSSGSAGYYVNGKVTLLGIVKTEALKTQVERVVKQVKGVKDVDNQITVLGE